MTPKDNPNARLPTYGEKAVGVTFNPSGDAGVNELKNLFATVIDMLDGWRTSTAETDEQKRLYSIAITHAQTAQMWAVKARTFPP
jgi:hypothetical protein